VTAVIDGVGTAEASWRPWLAEREWTRLDPSLVLGHRVVVLAAHPDDEVLGVGGLLAHLAIVKVPMVVIWASDGEASHPGSTVFDPAELALLRRAESTEAIAALGVQPEAVHHLGLPDSSLASHESELQTAIADLTRADDVVIAPWRGDGHPDHEAVGRVADRLTVASVWQYPIWMWHWARPGDERVPWDGLCASPVDDLPGKARAIAMFASQVQPIGPEPADEAVLAPHVVAHFQRANEWLFT
jgi:LmbE family N-acetylglucosaminyl deacetylase